MPLLYTTTDGSHFYTEAEALTHERVTEALVPVLEDATAFVENRYEGKAGRTRAFNTIREWETYKLTTIDD